MKDVTLNSRSNQKLISDTSYIKLFLNYKLVKFYNKFTGIKVFR